MKKFLIISLLFISCNKHSEVVVSRIIDGDTFITCDKEKVRLYNIDAPELNQPFGVEAKNLTESVLLGRTIILERKGKDKYGRTLADVRMKKHGSTFNRLLVLRGLAWTSGKFCHDKQLEEDMSYAKEMKEGLWASENATAPYIYRKNHKK